MNVRLDVRLELDDERKFVWWASSPDVDGFYAASDHLHELLERAESALRATFDADVSITATMVRPEEYSLGDKDFDHGDPRAVAVVDGEPASV